MQKFEITLKNEKQRLYNRISRLIIFILFVFFCYFAIFSEVKNVLFKSAGTVLLLLICFGLQLYFKNKKYTFSLRPFFLISMLGWISMENYWMAVITVLFAILYLVTDRRFDVLLSPVQIIYPSFPSRKINWQELNSVVVKDGLLTIDFKSNKLIQQYIDENNTQINEKEFNDFCREQLKTANLISFS